MLHEKIPFTTVRELSEKLSQFPPDLPVVLFSYEMGIVGSYVRFVDAGNDEDNDPGYRDEISPLEDAGFPEHIIVGGKEW
jgi:hypothetical protein